MIGRADVGHIAPVQVLLDVGPDYLELSAPGDTAPFRVPFDVGAFTPNYATSDVRSTSVEAVGQALWRTAFSGPLGSALDQAATRAISSGTSVTLRVVSRPDTPSASRWLPWELLFDPVGRDFLALKSGWSVVRGTSTRSVGRPFRTARPHLLVVSFTQPDGQPFPAVSEEIGAIRQAVGSVGDISVKAPNPTEDAFLAMLRNEPADIVHVIGAADREGLLIPGKDPAGVSSSASPSIIHSQAISAALAANEHVTLIVLSASHTEWIAEVIAGTVDVAVLGHRQDVADHHAAALIEAFYPSLLGGMSADTALTEARRALDRRFPGERAWVSAILMTGWPPPALPASAKNARANEPVADVRKDARQLAETIYRTDADRARQLLEIAWWSPLEQQLQHAERRLAELEAEGYK